MNHEVDNAALVDRTQILRRHAEIRDIVRQKVLGRPEKKREESGEDEQKAGQASSGVPSPASASKRSRFRSRAEASISTPPINETIPANDGGA